MNKIAKPVSEVNDHVREIIDDLYETMRNAEGVGLAAPQVGILRRICVIQTDFENGPVYELVNPVIVESRGDQFGNEGCLSVPGYVGKVHRPEWVKVEALDRNGKKCVYEGEGLLAVAFCHEIDHLDGIVYTSKAEDLSEIGAESDDQDASEEEK